MPSIDPALLWSGDFGAEYIARNEGPTAKAASLRLMASALKGVAFTSVMEFGANIGNNLEAISLLFPSAQLNAVEVNAQACSALRAQGVTTFEGSLVEFQSDQMYDLTMSVGVLIHIHPDQLPQAYSNIATSSRKYILLAEYYSPVPTEVVYRGITGALWKRDFAGEFMDAFPNFHLRRTGVTYHRQADGDDDLMWFLLERIK